MPDRVIRVLAYPRTIRYARAWTAPDGERRERQLDAMDDLGRPTMAAILAGIARRRTVQYVPADALGRGTFLDTPAGMLPCHRYRQHRLMVIANSGSLPRCHLEEPVYRAGVYWLWHNSCDDRLYRRFFAEPFHCRSRRLTWFVEPPEGDVDHTASVAGLRLVYCGRLDPEKRIDLLIQLLARLRDCDVSLSLVGAFEPTTEGAAYRRHVLGLIDALDLAQRVHLRGHLRGPALAAAIRRADLLVNLTVNHDETFGLAQAEALCLGTPVLASAWGGIKDVVTPACGLLADTLVCDAGTFVDLRAAERFVRRFAASAELRDEMARAARARGARFSWATLLAELDAHLAGDPEPVVEIDPDSTVEALVHQVLSPALLERITSYLNPTAMGEKLRAIHALRNGLVLGPEEWRRFAIIDPARHDEFTRQHYAFIYEPYGSLTPARAAQRLDRQARLVPLRSSVHWRGDAIDVDDPVFGEQHVSLSAPAARVLRACAAAPGIGVERLARDGPDDAATIVRSMKELLAHGLALPLYE